ncbi:hypothetical protein MPF_0965 [Methanohalophilus portucalensis FDF-1]|uniref:Uncharacterized protein n=1 Tax=Methanohalophilus portucalensis FDF-1 TaxID=523843 RepID=A0A1L9C6G5_9EURY|nr:hypothetical protein MPF_0965 [Methanohalophilus portucalensis FDF-1]
MYRNTFNINRYNSRAQKRILNKINSPEIISSLLQNIMHR